MWRPCIKCGVLVQGESYCPRHMPVRKTPGRASRAQAMFRAVVLKRAGWRCQWIGEDGERCDVRTGLSAHHVALYRETQSMDPSQGVALCGPHHRAAEQAAASMRPPAAA